MNPRVERGDPRLEDYRHVGEPRWLQDRGLFVAEGRLVVARLIEAGYDIPSILVTATALRALAPMPDPHRVLVADQAIVNDVTGFNFHRGCLALARRPPAIPLESFAAASRLAVVEGVNNPDNIGGIFRSAAAFGADGVVLDPSAGDPWYRKAVRTSMGAVLRLPFARASAWPADLRLLREHGLTLAALTPAGAMTVDEFAAARPRDARIALIVGAEGPGLTDAALREADVTLRIPVDPASDSLNVVVALSIALHRLRG
ncbi:MAG TPA: RNA methyltransferase [Vicinamibacterales bacterium]|nr:RNA methyltransferase [Vicinamibacterales bacterium]